MIREKIPLPAAELAPSPQEILRQQGVPARSEVSDQALHCAEDAHAQCLHFMKPRGILQEISREAGAALLIQEGVIHPEAPMPRIMARSDHLLLFAATLGEAISLRIRSLFTAGDYPLGTALDAAASLAADRAARLAGTGAENLISSSGVSEAPAFLPYSPGYCGWAVTGQRALFAALKPAEIGLTLNESCLMKPLKSVSGIILGGLPEIHIFRPEFPFCAQCTDRECVARMASVRTKGPAHE